LAAATAAITEAVDFAVQVREEIANRRRTAAAAATRVAARVVGAAAGRLAGRGGTARRGGGATASRFGGGAGGFTAARLAAPAAQHAIEQTGLRIGRQHEHRTKGDNGQNKTRLHGEDSCSCGDTNSGLKALELGRSCFFFRLQLSEVSSGFPPAFDRPDEVRVLPNVPSLPIDRDVTTDGRFADKL
jgi:hypothetical protein